MIAEGALHNGVGNHANSHCAKKAPGCSFVEQEQDLMPPIHRRNRFVLKFPDEHPAKQFLLAHQEFCARWVGFEVSYSHRPAHADDISWHSETQGALLKLSGVLYEFISLTPILDAWKAQPAGMTEAEDHQMQRIKQCRSVLQEAEEAARAQGNDRSLQIVNEARRVMELWTRALMSRTNHP